MSAIAAQPPRDEPAEIWLRQPRETTHAYAAFCLYREQTPPRSIGRLAKALGRGRRVLDGWSSKFHWLERAAAYSDHLDRVALQAHEDDIVRRRREENQKLYELGETVRAAAVARLIGVKDEKGKPVVLPIDPNSFDADDVAKWLDLGARHVRLALGLPTDVTGQIQINMSDVQKILGGFIDLAEKRMPPAEHEALVRDCYAMVQEALGA